jgi:hypothetical protein
MVKARTIGIIAVLGAVGAAGFIFKDAVATAIKGKPSGFFVEPTTWSDPGKIIFTFYLDGKPLRNVGIFANSNLFQHMLIKTDSEGRAALETNLWDPPLLSTGDITFELDPIITNLPTSLLFTVKFIPR